MSRKRVRVMLRASVERGPRPELDTQRVQIDIVNVRARRRVTYHTSWTIAEAMDSMGLVPARRFRRSLALARRTHLDQIRIRPEAQP